MSSTARSLSTSGFAATTSNGIRRSRPITVGIVLPVSLSWVGVGANETTVVLLHNQDTPGPIKERLLEHRGSQSAGSRI